MHACVYIPSRIPRRPGMQFRSSCAVHVPVYLKWNKEIIPNGPCYAIWGYLEAIVGKQLPANRY